MTRLSIAFFCAYILAAGCHGDQVCDTDTPTSVVSFQLAGPLPNSGFPDNNECPPIISNPPITTAYTSVFGITDKPYLEIKFEWACKDGCAQIFRVFYRDKLRPFPSLVLGSVWVPTPNLRLDVQATANIAPFNNKVIYREKVHGPGSMNTCIQCEGALGLPPTYYITYTSDPVNTTILNPLPTGTALMNTWNLSGLDELEALISWADWKTTCVEGV